MKRITTPSMIRMTPCLSEQREPQVAAADPYDDACLLMVFANSETLTPAVDHHLHPRGRDLQQPASFVKMEPNSSVSNPPLRGLCDEEVGILGHLLLENHTFEDELFPVPLAMHDNDLAISSESPSPELLPNSLSSSFMDLMAPLQAAEFSFRDAYNGIYGPASSYQSDVYMNNEGTHELDYRALDPPHMWSCLPACKPVRRRNAGNGYGGRTCAVPDCGKSSQGRGLCIRHGGGKRCSVEGCARGAQATGRCKAHGGGVRCKVDGCMKSSQGSGLCRTHGGGKICLFPGCKKGTQRGGKCSTHGGSRICMVDGCTKVDRGGGLCGIHKKTMDSSIAE
ncbi:hypothetical protein FI667_g940, partial [Globisporangium splendens]